MVFFEHDDDYRVKLSVFEGPIDLLLYLIKRKELDIHEISLAEIAKEYLEYVEIIKLIDLEKAGEFIVVASTLMKLKSQSLFSNNKDDGSADNEDLGKMLINYLIEYDKLGVAAEKLGEIENTRRMVFPRAGEKNRIIQYLSGKDEEESGYIVFDLLTAFKEVLKNAPKTKLHEVEIYNVTSEMKQSELLSLLDREGKADFIKIVEKQPKYIIVVTFVAILELMKKQLIIVKQSGQFGNISLYKREKENGIDDENQNS
jgi:segregation and condensation protein A